jgi:hypothetical protein
VREGNKERSERKNASRQQQQTAAVAELSGGKLSNASKAGVTNVTTTSEGKRDVLSGYVLVATVFLIVMIVWA